MARHFLGSLSPDCVYKKSKASFAAGSETFTTSGTMVVRPGFTVSLAVCSNSFVAVTIQLLP